jgi:NTP pyrophosphatase (non-canonical NTP hydrolase)
MTYDEAVSIAHEVKSSVMSLDELFNAYVKFNAVVENTPNWMPNQTLDFIHRGAGNIGGSISMQRNAGASLTDTAHGGVAVTHSEGKPLDWQRALHGAIGLCTESAEILDLFKKELYGKHKPLSISHVQEELGDQLFYIVVILRAFDIDIRRVLADNIMKLANRYIEKMKTHV